MKKTALLLLCATALTAGVVVAATISNTVFPSEVKQGFADEVTYTIDLDGTSLAGANGSGSVNVETSGGASIQFDYSDLTIVEGNLSFAEGGYILNPRVSGGLKNRITKIKTVTSYAADKGSFEFAVDYTWGDSLDAETSYYQRRGYVLHNTGENEQATFGFLDERPNYLKLSASSAFVVERITIAYACSGDPNDEGTENLVINSASMFERFKTCVNAGNDFEGQTVELGANIDMSETPTQPIGNTTYPFSGTFDGKGHSIANLAVSGSTQIAAFGNVVDGAIKNVIFDNITASATGQRAAGAVGRSERSDIENVTVNGGTIQGTSQNGGIVGVVVGGSSIINCYNSAAVTGTTGGGNGGILGYYQNSSGTADTSSVKVYNCVNDGDVSSAKASQTTGGLVGAANTAHKIALDISLCEVGKDAVISCNGTEATAARAAQGFIIGSSDTSKITVIGSGRVTDEIANMADWSSFVDSCAEDPYYRYKVAELVDDLDFEGSDLMVPQFSGLLDGNGHSISNLKLTGETGIALLGQCENGGVKNLNLTGIDIYASTEQSAGLIGKAINAVVDSVKVLSGTIGSSGMKVKANNAGIVGLAQGVVSISDCENTAKIYATGIGNGGIVGGVAKTAATKVSISNCANSGDINSTAEQVGGIIGGVNSALPTIVVKDSINRASVVGAGNGTGGILGATGGGGTSVTILEGCVNEGAISGNAYVGGIAGILREGNKTTSYVLDCVNKANITSSGVGCGGITGISRINTTDCACLHSVTIKGQLASTLSAFGSRVNGNGGAGSTPGFVSGTAGNDATVTGKLINADGTDYVAA